MNVSPALSTADPNERLPVYEARRPLRVLLVEDSEDDAALVLRTLRRAGYELDWERVQTADTLTEALARRAWDIVLSDYNMPQFDALQALRTLRGQSAHLPFIIISGSIGEETAVAAMRAGANDYVMKTNLPRLVPAVERELRDAAERQERARTERALFDLQARFQTIFNESLDGLIVLDLHGTIRHLNRAVSRTLGYDERFLIGQPFTIVWPERHRSMSKSVLEQVWQRGSAFHAGPFRRLNGTFCPMDLQASKVSWGHEEAIIVTLRDATERQQAEQRLADEKEQLAVTLRSMGDGVVTTDMLGQIVLLNGAAERLTGWSQQEAKGQQVSEVLPLTCGDEQDECGGFWQVVLQSGGPVTLNRQVRTRDRTGREYLLAIKAAPIASHDGSHSGVVTVFRDITLEQKAEEELQKASKLESVALLAGGIAHDFNNMLTAILGHLSLAKMTDDPPRQVLETVEKACLYATDLTRQLLTFSKGSNPVRRREDLAALVEESVRFASHGSHVRCRFDLAGDLPRVELDRGQINQVLNNLVINALQASPEGGTLDVGVAAVTISEEKRVGTLKVGDYVRITLRDHGIGISAENLARIFDPYFTTKASGSGLGLATSYSIIKKHGGLIQAESEPGKGTSFVIYLPVGGADTPSQAAEANSSVWQAEEVRPGGRVLFMDDEAILQELVAAMLEHLGYEVTCAAHGEEAVALYTEAKQAGREFDVVIVDLTVPGGMGGHETLRQLLIIDPGVKAVVSSGYSNDPIMAEHRRHGFSGVIAKPYQMAELSQVLQGVIRKLRD